MRVYKIGRKYIMENGFDGLFNSDAECGCLLDDLAPCGEMGQECQPGYKTKCRCGEGCDFDVSKTPDEPDEELRTYKKTLLCIDCVHCDRPVGYASDVCTLPSSGPSLSVPAECPFVVQKTPDKPDEEKMEEKMQVNGIVTCHPFAYWCEGCESESVVYVDEGDAVNQSIQCLTCGLCAAELTGPVESLIDFDDEEESELIKCPACGAEF